MFKKKPINILLLILGNSIPLIGYFVLEWDFGSIYMFYFIELLAYELVTIPSVFVFGFANQEYKWDSFAAKLFKAILWIIYRLFMFFLLATFLMQLIFAKEELSPGEAKNRFFLFIGGNLTMIIYTFAWYFYSFFRKTFQKDFYKTLSVESFQIEIALLPIVLLVSISILNATAPFNFDLYQLLFLFAMVILKTVSQIWIQPKRPHQQQGL